jgi:ABC-2 type transport system permease protein
MSAFLYTLKLKTKLDLRNRDILITYYLVPILFFIVMSFVFTSTNPEAVKTLISSMIIFSTTMGSIIGAPGSVINYFENSMVKTFKSSGIPLWSVLLSSIISGAINLTVVSIFIYFISPIMYDAVIPGNPLYYFLKFILFLTATLLIGTILGVFAKSTSKLTMYSQIIFLPSMLFSGIMFPSEMLPDFLKFLGLFLPATHGMRLLSSVTFDTFSFGVIIAIILLSILIISVKLKKIKVD